MSQTGDGKSLKSFNWGNNRRKENQDGEEGGSEKPVMKDLEMRP